MGEATWGPSAEDTQGVPAGQYDWPATAPPRRRRQIFGRVYETIERGQRDGEHRYVGKTETTVHQRVHGPNGHTSPASIAKDPWKANILPGKAGYRLLENVYDTGDPAENDRALRRAEAYWIDRLRTPRNVVRPIRPPTTAVQPPKRERRPAPPPRPRRPTADERRHRRVRRRLFALAWAMAVCAMTIGILVHLSGAPFPLPLVAAAAGAAIAARIFHAMLAYYRKLARA